MAVEVELARRLFTVAEYHRMGEAGILGEDERVELIEGEIVQMAPIGPRHVGFVITSTDCLSLGSVIVPWSHHRIPSSSRLGRSRSPICFCYGRGRSPTAESFRPRRTSCLPSKWPIRLSASTASSRRVSMPGRASPSSDSVWR